MLRERAATILLALGIAWVPAPVASGQLATATARTVVEPRSYLSLDAAPRGRTFDLAVVATIKRGYHINAHQLRNRYLIPTELEADFPAGFRVREITYPPGKLLKFPFAPEGLRVYTGNVTLRARVAVLEDAPLGTRKLPVELRYQACNSQMCLPPVKIPVVVEVRVVPAGTAVRPVHPEIFNPHKAAVRVAPRK
jgi:Thiol:disulfide interchange protein DsbD, N-terminal